MNKLAQHPNHPLHPHILESIQNMRRDGVSVSCRNRGNSEQPVNGDAQGHGKVWQSLGARAGTFSFPALYALVGNAQQARQVILREPNLCPSGSESFSQIHSLVFLRINLFPNKTTLPHHLGQHHVALSNIIHETSSGVK